MAGGESKAECDQRVARLWSRLGAEKKEHLDYNGLKKGLRRIDHPLKNADTMLQAIFRSVDTNGDGIIEYSGKITRHRIVTSPRHSSTCRQVVI
jgi:solute carrier family 25 phosphate transporter 23/24/25/41